MLFEWNEVVAEHQIRGNRTEKFRIDSLLAQIDKGNAITFRKASGIVPIVLLFGTENSCGNDRIVLCGSHNILAARSSRD